VINSQDVSISSGPRQRPTQPDGVQEIPHERPTTMLLIRHAHTNDVGLRLTGREPGVPLSKIGFAQAERLGRRLAQVPLHAIYTSPLQRAVETADAVRREQRLAVRVCNELCEIDFGVWTGRLFVDLDRDPEWRRFNGARENAAIPDGEQIATAQCRIVSALRRLAERHPGDTVAVVSHAEVVRLALLHYTGTAINHFARFVIEPASVSAIVLSGEQTTVRYIGDDSFAAE
jgi:broad specificity phosphatase PhoE